MSNLMAKFAIVMNRALLWLVSILFSRSLATREALCNMLLDNILPVVTDMHIKGKHVILLDWTVEDRRHLMSDYCLRVF